jgi:hypothetical protein
MEIIVESAVFSRWNAFRDFGAYLKAITDDITVHVLVLELNAEPIV